MLLGDILSSLAKHAPIVVVYLLMCITNQSYALKSVLNQNRVFEIDYEHDQFLKDGEPFRYVSGSLHYFRVPQSYWRDRLKKYRAAGLNAVCTYIEWRRHEPQPGVYDFRGDNDFEQFIKLAQEEGLLVILRPGPYIDSERDFGGYPPWLLHENQYMGLRTNESSHTKYIYSWLRVLMPRIQPLLYGNGGPIVMLQVENEYGSYPACDRNYTRWLRDVFRSYVGDKTVLFTTDGDGTRYLKCGPIPGVLATVDFGAVKNATKAFEPLREFQKHGPLVNSEFYCGRLTHWGDPQRSRIPTDRIVSTLRQLLSLNASLNFYMFHGFESGANSLPFRPQLTSYDFDAPISESGNLTEKYFAIKAVLSEYLSVKELPDPSKSPGNYGIIKMDPMIALFESNTGVVYGKFQYPKTFEALQQYSGFMLYETVLPVGYKGRGFLEANNTHDRTIVYVNKEPAGVFSRTDSTYSLMIDGKEGQSLRLLVENQGHINYMNMTDIKGLTSNVTLEGVILAGWTQTGYPMNNVSSLYSLPGVKTVTLPALYAGSFSIPQGLKSPADTFVDLTGWGKGVLYVNGFNLGRYWPMEGPQITLYLPGPLLRMNENNTITVMELEREHPNRTVSFVAQPI